MDGTEYLKYVTERVVTYMERPREEEKRETHGKEPWLTRWFGVAPMGLMVWWASRSDRKSKTRPEARSMDSARN
ncbi:YqzE family protein [Cohnella cellulosilytica]|uniref:YqzE family protein n=1 Tax=Cohnella cellulosilytica TaxID=986710 RepID=A0ABW2F366_9BACL